MVSVSDIEAAVRGWERRAKSEMYLDDFLHPKARAWLIEAMIEAIEPLHAQSAPESSEVESSRVESVQRDVNKEWTRTLRDAALAGQPTRKKGR